MFILLQVYDSIDFWHTFLKSLENYYSSVLERILTTYNNNKRSMNADQIRSKRKGVLEQRQFFYRFVYYLLVFYRQKKIKTEHTLWQPIHSSSNSYLRVVMPLSYLN
jgi:hypothetical protein